jgi:hypothetical protein
MNEFMQIVQQKTGLSPEMAQKVIETITGYLKTKLQEPMAAGLDSLLSTGSAGTEAASDAAAGAGGIMEKAKSMVAGVSSALGNKSA